MDSTEYYLKSTRGHMKNVLKQVAAMRRGRAGGEDISKGSLEYIEEETDTALTQLGYLLDGD